METQRVVLLGHSLLIDGVAASLSDRPGVQMVRIFPDTADFARQVRALKPHLVIFELAPSRTHQLLALLEGQPDIQLVGIDPECSRLMVLSGHQHTLATMQDLIDMLEAHTAKSEPASDTLPAQQS